VSGTHIFHLWYWLVSTSKRATNKLFDKTNLIFVVFLFYNTCTNTGSPIRTLSIGVIYNIHFVWRILGWTGYITFYSNFLSFCWWLNVQLSRYFILLLLYQPISWLDNAETPSLVKRAVQRTFFRYYWRVNHIKGGLIEQVKHFPERKLRFIVSRCKCHQWTCIQAESRRFNRRVRLK
jgi:hypothetical protein